MNSSFCLAFFIQNPFVQEFTALIHLTSLGLALCLRPTSTKTMFDGVRDILELQVDGIARWQVVKRTQLHLILSLYAAL